MQEAVASEWTPFADGPAGRLYFREVWVSRPAPLLAERAAETEIVERAPTTEATVWTARDAALSLAVVVLLIALLYSSGGRPKP